MSQLPAPTPADIAELTRLHRATRYLDAWHIFEKFSPPETWTNLEGVIIVGRLFTCWGDWGRSNRLHARSWRSAPTAPAAIYYQTLTLESKHGPFEALAFLRSQRPDAALPDPRGYLNWLQLLEARLRGTFRDFDAAEAIVRATEAEAAHDPWWWVEVARLREKQDRYADAMVAAEKALQLGPDYRPSIESVAHLLMLGNRDEEALTLLRQSLQRLQSASLAQMQAILLDEMGRHEEILPVLDAAAGWLPCADRSQRAWLASRRSDALRALGREAEAIEQAALVKYPFHEHIVQRLRAPAESTKKVHLRVPFVRQHHATCAPATLSALGAYWQRPVDHLELARVICYDGTPDHEERNWAETHGWVVREFRVTWDAAVALLDAGCPFTLTTVATRSAHLQAVVGYDARVGLLQIRDPYLRTHSECIAAPFLEKAASHGPRGMVLVPPEKATLLDGIVLPDTELYDLWYALRRALVRHDRSAAGGYAERLATAAPDHLLTLQAQRELAFYDGNVLRQLESTRAQLARFPDNHNLQLDEAQLLAAAGHAQERRARLETLGRDHRKEPLFLRELGELLAEDARTHPRAFRALRNVLRRHAVDAGNLRAFANLLWNQRRFDDATDVYRLAACVGDKNENHWSSFFIASRHTRRGDEALELLRQRDTRLGAQSGQPARTLFRAYETLDRTPEGFAVLDAALLKRSDEGELLLYAAEQRGRFGHTAEAMRLLAAAESKTSRVLWLRTAARLDEQRLEYAAALARWRELLSLNPVDLNGHTAIASLLASLEGSPAALAFLQEARERHPHQISLHEQVITWLRREPPENALAAIDRLLALEPTNAWALREKALTFRRQHRLDEALSIAETAKLIEPGHSASHGVLGLVYESQGRNPESQAAFEDALRLSIDSDYMGNLLAACPDFAAKTAAMQFVQRELTRQPVQDGVGFLNFRNIARGVLAPGEMRAALDALLSIHAGNWGIWSALGSHLLDQGEIPAALARLREGVERFPLVPRLWLDLATAQARARESETEIESLRRTLELSPTWGFASRTLAAAYERVLDLGQAEHSLRRALAADPLDAISHGHLASLLWRREQKDEALQLLERAVKLEPGYDWAWDQLDRWSQERKEPRRAVDLGEAVTKARPGDIRAWLRLARLQGREPDTALATLDHALTIDPRESDIHDLRAVFLVQAKRYDEALAACRPAVFNGHTPRELLGRAAWVEYSRGRIQPAIEQAKVLVSIHPDYTWGWACLAEWHWETEQIGDTENAATKWAWLAPNELMPFAYLATAQERSGKRREAKLNYWRALHCDPAYGYGAQRLLRMLTEDREDTEAARLLRHIETHLTPADAQRAAVFYHIMRRDQAAAGTALAALARAHDNRDHLLQEAFNAIIQEGWRSLAEKTLEPLLTDPAMPPRLGRLWVSAWLPYETWAKLRLLEKPGVPEAVARHGWATALEHMGKNRATLRLRWLAFRRKKWLAADDLTWGSMGYAFLTAQLHGRAARWMSDWRAHPHTATWMLYNLVVAFREKKETAEAMAVINHALTLPADENRCAFLVWRGLDECLRGDIPAAKATWASLDGTTLDKAVAFEHAIFDLLIKFESQLFIDAADALKTAKQRLKEEVAQVPNMATHTAAQHLRDRVLHRLGTAANSRWTRVQSYLPAFGMRNDTARPVNSGSGANASGMIWILVFVAMGAMRACTSH